MRHLAHPGHTISDGDPPHPYAADRRFCCALLVNPQTTTPVAFDQLEVAEGKLIGFLAVIPLYLEEVDLKLE